jgi:hypothetical protein
MSAVQAYRKDVEKRKGPIGKDDGAWIAISTMVGQVGSARGVDRRRILDEAAGMAAELFDASELAYGCAYDPTRVDRQSSVARLRLLAERIENHGSLNLAMSMVDALRGMLPSDSINGGRVHAHRARLTWKIGRADLALARYRSLNRKACEFRSNELLVRAWAGYGALAQLRGNYPEVRIWAGKVVSRAEQCSFGGLASIGHHGLMVAFAVASEFSNAISHGWTAYRLRDGNRIGQQEMLANIGRLFLDAGSPDVAKAALTRVLAGRPAARVAAAAIGGYALAAAALGDGRSVLWAAAEASSLSDGGTPSYASASALLDCANALDAIDDSPYASVLRARGSTIAQYGGYHELVLRSDSLPAKRPADLSNPAIEVAAEIQRLPGAELPDHLELSVS